MLIVELDGPAAEVRHQFEQVTGMCEAAGATEIRIAADDAQRALFWKGRKSAFAAVGRISPDYIVQDGVIPRTALGPALRRIEQLASERGVRVANVFHAGDGNLHPLVLFDDAVPGEAERAEDVSGAIIDLCIELGGSITGEHGVGSDKAKHMPKMFTEDDLDTMQLLRCAFDPTSISNPGKIFPTPRLCGEVPRRAHAADGAHPRRGRSGGRVLMTTTTDLLSRLTDATAGSAREGTDLDAVDGLRPRWVVSPADTEGVAAVLRTAHDEGLAVVPTGSGTKLGWGAPPQRLDILLQLGRLDALVDHAAGDLVAVVGAGRRLDDLQGDLSSAGQWLAVDPARRGTVGGLVATADTGPTRLVHGPVRDLVIGATVVRADGVVAHAGGRVVKNVAGYDLSKLLTGSFGTLGVLTQVAVRLHPVPEASRWVVVTVPSAQHARELVQGVVHSQLVMTGCELERPAGESPSSPCGSTASLPPCLRGPMPLSRCSVAVLSSSPRRRPGGGAILARTVTCDSR